MKKKEFEKYVMLEAENGKTLFNTSNPNQTSPISQATVSKANADKWVEIDVDELPKYTTEEYEQKVEELIRTRYSVSAELAILRQRDSKAEEFAEYDAFAEECKREAKEVLSKPHHPDVEPEEM